MPGCAVGKIPDGRLFADVMGVEGRHRNGVTTRPSDAYLHRGGVVDILAASAQLAVTQSFELLGADAVRLSQ